jgi:catechol 2,3-dioxygenase-like lactoylglutathione lyase family enzyme
METYIRNIVFACPDPEVLAKFYAELLGMRILRTDWYVVAKDENSFPRLAFGDGPGEYRPPRWPDPDYPQQLHLDIPVYDLDAAEDPALRLGATRLQDSGAYRTYADPVGHPFCFYTVAGEGAQSGRSLPGTIGQVVIDCFSPRSLATFYEGLLGMHREEDSQNRVTIAAEDPNVPKLAFQHAVFLAARWPDPAYPQQIHLDLHVADGRAAEELAVSLGAIRLPAMGGSCPVFADPAAHPFCLCSPGQ